MTAGVYAIINKINGKAYIGSSKNVELRLSHHKCYIKNRKFLHYQGYKNDAILYGVDAFEFKLLKATETAEEAEELETEFLSIWIDGLYNKAPHANGSTGVKRNRETYIKAAAKRLLDPGYRQKLSQACKGKRQIVKCPHCGLEGGGGNMRRYHFEACSKK